MLARGRGGSHRRMRDTWIRKRAVGAASAGGSGGNVIRHERVRTRRRGRVLRCVRALCERLLAFDALHRVNWCHDHHSRLRTVSPPLFVPPLARRSRVLLQRRASVTRNHRHRHRSPPMVPRDTAGTATTSSADPGLIDRTPPAAAWLKGRTQCLGRRWNFPPRDGTLQFRQQLEAAYRDALRRIAVHRASWTSKAPSSGPRNICVIASTAVRIRTRSRASRRRSRGEASSRFARTSPGRR